MTSLHTDPAAGLSQDTRDAATLAIVRRVDDVEDRHTILYALGLAEDPEIGGKRYPSGERRPEYRQPAVKPPPAPKIVDAAEVRRHLAAMRAAGMTRAAIAAATGIHHNTVTCLIRGRQKRIHCDLAATILAVPIPEVRGG